MPLVLRQAAPKPPGKPYTLRGAAIRRRQEQAERLEEVREWLRGRWYGATRAQLAARFEWYEGAQSGSRGEMRLYRDLRELLKGEFVLVGGTKYRGGWTLIRADRAHVVVMDEP